jgi:hypothetical protein
LLGSSHLDQVDDGARLVLEVADGLPVAADDAANMLGRHGNLRFRVSGLQGEKETKDLEESTIFGAGGNKRQSARL